MKGRGPKTPWFGPCPSPLHPITGRGSLCIWFDPTMAWHAAKASKHGHPEVFSESAIQTCLTLKVLSGLPLQQTVGLFVSLIEMAGLDGSVPDFSLSPPRATCGADPLPLPRRTGEAACR